MSWSPIRIRPAVGSSRPATMRRVVVLPQPDGPSRAKNEPLGTVSDRSRTAVKSPKRLVRSSRWRSWFVSTTHHPVELLLVVVRLFLVQRHELVALLQGLGAREDELAVDRRLVELRDLLLCPLDRAEVVVPRGQLRRVDRVVVEVHHRLDVL